jgi:chemotaxis protein MotB
VLKKDVLDVAEQILNENESYESKLVVLEKSFADLQKDVAKALEASLQKVTGSNDQQASVAIIGNRVRVRLSDELLFPSASAQMSPAGLRALGQIADVLRTTPSRRIEVAGHTDDRAVLRGWDDNWQLSTERARQVGLFLISHGLESKRLFIAGYADTDPAEAGVTESARAKNRRVEIFIEPTQPGSSDGKTAAPTRTTPTSVESSFKPAPPAK